MAMDAVVPAIELLRASTSAIRWLSAEGRSNRTKFDDAVADLSVSWKSTREKDTGKLVENH